MGFSFHAGATATTRRIVDCGRFAVKDTNDREGSHDCPRLSPLLDTPLGLS
jgi:hypothetical protein